MRETPRAVGLYALGLGCILSLLVWFYWPTLSDGLFADDFVAAAIIDGQFAAKRAAWDLFNFAGGTPSDVQALRRLGSLPWWAPDDYRIAFLRPLSSALWHLDRALFGLHYSAYHAHSLLVFCVLVGCVSWLYRRLFSAGVALLATLVFAIDHSLHFPVAWLSNRGGIYALLLGTLALLAHLRFRETGRPRYAWACTLATSFGVLFGEWALPMVSYIVAWEVAVMSGPWRVRLRALIPSLAPALLFVIARSALRYGARGSGAYIDPGVDPVRFLGSVLHRVPVFVADMVWNIPSEWWDHGSPWRDDLLRLWIIPPSTWTHLPSWQSLQVSLGLLSMALLFVGYRVCRPGLQDGERRHVHFLVLGALFALVPVVGSFPSTRLTIAAFLGLSPVFALLLRECWRRLRTSVTSRSGGRRSLGWLTVAAAISYTQLVSPLQVDMQSLVDYYATTREWAWAAELDPARLPEQHVFMLAGGEFTTTFFFAYIWSHAAVAQGQQPRPLPRTYYPITACPCAHYVMRTGPDELLLRSLGRSYLSSGDENMFQSPQRIWREGETIALDQLSIRVEQVVAGVPGALRLHFARPLEDPSYVFLNAVPHGIARAQLPPVGGQTLIARAAYPNWIQLERHRDFTRFGALPEWLWFYPTPGFVAYAPP